MKDLLYFLFKDFVMKFFIKMGIVRRNFTGLTTNSSEEKVL